MSSPGPFGVVLFVGLCTGPFHMIGLSDEQSLYGGVALAFLIGVVAHSGPRPEKPGEDQPRRSQPRRRGDA